MSIVLADNKIIKIEILRRISDWKNGSPIWETTWEDVSEYYIETVTDYEFSIDDNNLTGKYSQESINIKFSNAEGAFNPENTDFSLWQTEQYMYHSRLRVYEWVDQTQAEPTADDLVLDGLIAVSRPKYYLNGDCNVLVNSKLDILRDHYMVTETNSRSNTASSQGILNYIIYLYDTYYSSLEIEVSGGVFYNNINYSDLNAYGSNLLDLF